MYVSDPTLQDMCESYIIDAGRRKYVPIHQIWRLQPQFDSWDWEDSRPDWLDDAIQESRWSYETVWDNDSGVAWTFDDRMIINAPFRSEEHTSELQSRFDLVCRLLPEKKKRTLDYG